MGTDICTKEEIMLNSIKKFIISFLEIATLGVLLFVAGLLIFVLSIPLTILSCTAKDDPKARFKGLIKKSVH